MARSPNMHMLEHLSDFSAFQRSNQNERSPSGSKVSSSQRSIGITAKVKNYVGAVRKKFLVHAHAKNHKPALGADDKVRPLTHTCTFARAELRLVPRPKHFGRPKPEHSGWWESTKLTG